MLKEIKMDLDGLGIIMYSGHAVKHIQEGEDYLSNNYMQVSDVLRHVYEGSIVGFCTGSAGEYIIKVFTGYPNDDINYDFSLRLGIEVTDENVNFRDLYDLMEWQIECTENFKIKLDNGFYHITVCSNLPLSRLRGDHQEIEIYFNKIDEMPKLKYAGVPFLWNPSMPNT